MALDTQGSTLLATALPTPTGAVPFTGLALKPPVCDCLVPSLPSEKQNQPWKPQPGTPDITEKPGLREAPTPLS